ncbi:GTP cyclohydrolase FolE2 [Pelistega europaea]|uniref:GTP cyclohydrolase FolE2 n=1 Tax=Pelistega europaea TaxID=106147 RepID=A0A7Y4LA38_9BURK|nr:GTP cyclohydrolase FolE2 [Pelistega europaea]NOL49804.1 GTP cyclohydrolase I FolE2 [Pelistega europaea]
MSEPLGTVMPDVQSSFDPRHIAIQRVGIRRIKSPLVLQQPDGSLQSTVGEWTLTVFLPETEKGTHMSRFAALLFEHRQTPMTIQRFQQLAVDMLPLLHAEQGDITVTFPYFMTKKAPVSEVPSLMDYQITWMAKAWRDSTEFTLTIQVPVMSLCPCSKAISEYGAHNQRSHITVELVSREAFNMDEIIRKIEHQGASELWTLLKRPDEKFVTEHSYDNPKFVEDLIRDVAAEIKGLPGLLRYKIEAENFESIHNHSAYAVIEGEV